MDLSTQLHAVAGLGAVALGIGVLTRAPARRRNRLFSELCAALAVWNLGVVGRATGIAPGFPWPAVYLLGACASAPLAMHFSLTVAGTSGRPRRVLLSIGYGAAAALWLSSWWLHGQRAWNQTALSLLGTLLVVALVVLGSHVFTLPAGRERATLRLVVTAGVLAVAGGLSDFLPRGAVDVPKLGPVFVMLFLLIVSAVVVRHRFLDVDVYLARAAALITGAAVVAMLLLVVTRSFGSGYLVLLLASVALLAAALPLGRLLLSRTQGLTAAGDSLTVMLVGTSRQLESARETDQVWEAIDAGLRALPEGVQMSIYRRDAGTGRFRLARAASATGRGELPAGAALPGMLDRERSALTVRLLEIDLREASAERRDLARAALDEMRSMDSEVVVPLFGDEQLVGWIGLGGGNRDLYLRAEVAAALVAVGQQALSSLARIRVIEEARRNEALAAVGQLAAGLAHEVRNPVAAIRGAAQAINPDATPEQASEMLDVIQEETTRLDRVVGEFLDYARPSSPRREPVDLGSIAESVQRDARLAALDLEIELIVENGTPPALGDAEQIRRAFENLVRNASEAATSRGKLEIRIARDGERVQARFEDDGPGIPDERIPTLFQPFRTTRAEGTGLGLALVHRIVESHGGEIRVDGRPGVGAVFTLLLPAAASNEAENESVPDSGKMES